MPALPRIADSLLTLYDVTVANVTQAPAHYWVIDFVDPATNKIIAESETFSILPPDSE